MGSWQAGVILYLIELIFRRKKIKDSQPNCATQKDAPIGHEEAYVGFHGDYLLSSFVTLKNVKRRKNNE